MARPRTSVREPVAGGEGIAATRERQATREAFETNAPRQQLFWSWSALNLGNTTVRRFLKVADSDAAPSAVENQSKLPAPGNGILTKLRVLLAAPIVGMSVKVFVRVNGEDTGLRATVAAGRDTAVASVTVPVREGDTVSIATEASPADGGVSCFPRATVLWRSAA